MLILLPPSESKSHHDPSAANRKSAGSRLDLESLALTSGPVTALRSRVIDALTAVSADGDWAAALKVSAGVADEVAANTVLRTAAVQPVSRLYTGVLYDALDLPTLTGPAKARATRAVVVFSALFGALRLTDRVPPYRLSMGVNLPQIGPLAGAWRGVLDEVLPTAAGAGAIVDARSSTYAAAWAPRGELAERWVRIEVPGATHQAKHTRGLVARALCQAGGSARTPQQVAAALDGQFEVEVVEPARTTAPWSLRVR